MKASCQCGKLTATVADGAQAVTVMCHCRDCQRRTGSPFGTIAYFPREAVAITGSPREYSRAGDSGQTLTRGFCPECGSAVYVKASRMPDITGVPVGALNDPSFPMPTRSVYEESKHDWVVLPDGMTHHPRGRDSSW
ncbi:MAG TPA: GFA family protein [Croceibacterium sp.]|jgi:hypothetical protein|nr:GFA family protein [Croceibacterium sp.]